MQAARARDVEAVRTLMARHMQDAASNVKRMKGRIQGRLILDADTLRSPRSAHVRPTAPAKVSKPRTGG